MISEGAMKKAKIAILIALLALTVLATGAAAMASANYRLDWFAPATGTGGSAESASYAMRFTVGQSAIYPADSTNYRAGLGFWYGWGEIAEFVQVFLPAILR